MFVIVTKYTGTPHAINLVRSIRKHHGDVEILNVDSASEDKSYFDELRKENVIIADIDNRHYTTGAIEHAYDCYPREYYFFFQDSMELMRNIDYCKRYKLSTWAYFPLKEYGVPELEWAKNQLATHTKFNPALLDNPAAYGVAGPMVYCYRSVLTDLYSTGFKEIREVTKEQNDSMNRVWGVVLTAMGYDIFENSLMGNWLHIGYPNNPPNAPLLKFFLARA